MPTPPQLLTIADLRGGRSRDRLSPLSMDSNQAFELTNIDFYNTTFGRKRNGCSSIDLTFSAGGPFTGKISSIYRHVPGADETAAELWMVDGAATNVIGRKTAGASFTAPTLKDNPTGNGWNYSFVSAAGKLFIAYQSAQDRLHVWDPVNSVVRRVGFPAPAAPTVANTGAGAYAAVLRYYRCRWTEQQSGVTVRRSDPGNSVSFTPSGAGTAARITRPSSISENETHWEVEASTDGVTFYLLATVAIGTSTYDDSAATTTYANGTASAITGFYGLIGSQKFIAGDQNRILLFGSNVSTNPQNRVYFTAVNGSSGVGDLERLDATKTYYIDLDEHDSGDPTGLEGPVFGNYYAFKVKQFWEIRPTGDVDAPFQRTAISKTIGAVGPRAHCIGEDAEGRPALYFMSHRGMYRYGVGGLQYIGQGIEDWVLGTDTTLYTNRINLSAQVPCHMVYHAEKRQLWVWWAVGTSATADPTVLGVLHVGAGPSCWTIYQTTAGALIENARCSAMIPRTLGASSARDLKPAIGGQANNVAYMCDDPNATQDGSTSFLAVIILFLSPWGFGRRGRIGDLRILASNLSGTTINARTYQDGPQAVFQSSSASLTVTNLDEYASRRLEGTALAECEFVRIALGEFVSTNSSAWTLHGVVIPWWPSELTAT